jgi:cytochrome c oxidase cbb3-type subunit III
MGCSPREVGISPSYAAKATGNPAQGELVYGTYCASCHGPAGQGRPKESAITNDSFLALVSDQGLRTIVITAGRNWARQTGAEMFPGKPMTDQEITDVVAWFA